VAFEAGSAQAVAAFEVADAAFAADPELRESAVGLFRAGRLAAGDERSVRRREMLLDGAGRKAAIERELARAQTELVEPVAGPGDEVALVRRPDLGGRCSDVGASARNRPATDRW